MQDSIPGLSSRSSQTQSQTATAAVRDESRNPDGSVREVWRYLLDGVNTLGAAGLAERHEKARRILRDDGATYNVYSQNQGAMRPWELIWCPSSSAATSGRKSNPACWSGRSCSICCCATFTARAI
ncbi:MAG: hypothetical protein NVV73_16140 [Cellvibrionaceae bacterium]|nr:hypothetical protein [Cellvibrionaceae bacterium]